MYCSGLAEIVNTPVLRKTVKRGISVLAFKLKFNSRFQGENNKNVKSTYCVDAECWDAAAELIYRSCKEGDKLFIHGHMRNNTWIDNNGKERSRDTLRVDSFELVNSVYNEPQEEEALSGSES